jgi:hypothetical protein
MRGVEVARLGIDRDFLWEFGKLERAIQEKVHGRVRQVRAGHPFRLLDGVSNADLDRPGIDGQILPFARVLTDPDQLESARGILPEAQYDVLVGLAIGMSPRAGVGGDGRRCDGGRRVRHLPMSRPRWPVRRSACSSSLHPCPREPDGLLARDTEPLLPT